MAVKRSKNELTTRTLHAGRGARSANMKIVLDELRTQGPLSQAAIARQTRLSKASVNNIVKDLCGSGDAVIVAVNGREGLVQLTTARGAVVAVNFGPDGIHGAIFSFDTEKRIDSQIELREASAAPEMSLGMVVEFVRHLARLAGKRVSELLGVSVAVQAPIELATGCITSWAASRLPKLKDVPIQNFLSEALNLPVVVDNDANFAALAEWTWGCGKGAEDFLYVICSEQIGGGLVIGGKIYRGGTGVAGEIGHMVLTDSGPLCFCGSRGCLSAYASGRAILSVLQASELPKASLQDVIASAKHGDAACQSVLHEAGRSLGYALSNAARLIAPNIIAIGGALGQAGSFVFDGLRSSFEVPNMRAIADAITLCTGRLPGDAALLGGAAGLLASQDKGISQLPGWMLASATAGHKLLVNAG